MKKIFLFIAFFGCVAFTANAQSCTKTASKSCCAKTTAAAAKLAAADNTIEAKTCSKSGKVTYYKNYTCSVSGKTTTTQVNYDATTQKFVNVSPSKMVKEAANGGKNAKKSCNPAACTKKSAKTVKTVKTAKTAKAVKTSAKKSCDPKNCDPAACKKGAKAAKVSNAKLVKAEN